LVSHVVVALTGRATRLLLFALHPRHIHVRNLPNHNTDTGREQNERQEEEKKRQQAKRREEKG
jgi:hypothetical protein